MRSRRRGIPAAAIASLAGLIALAVSPATPAGTASATGAHTAAASSSAKASNGRIAFVLTPVAAEEGCGGAAGDLATANPDGSACRVLVQTADVSTPSWNPMADTVAFVRTDKGISTIWLVDADGANEHQLVAGPGQAYDPAWSPDGKQIAFTSDRTGTPEIYVADASSGSVLSQLTTGQSASMQPGWSPDGSQIVFVSNRNGTSQVFVMAADGSNARSVSPPGSVSVEPSWSPDGRKLAFASDQLTPGRFQIYVSRSDGSSQSRAVADKLDDEQPTWSPDGNLIAFTQEPGSESTVQLIPAPGASKQSPATLPGFPGAQASWGRLPLPTGPVPGVSVDATPKGKVKVQPGGSSLAVPLNGSASIPVAKATIFTPAPGASVVLSTKLADGRSAVITITKGAVAVTQPGGGQATRIALIGEPRAKCPVSHALNSAFRPAMPNWGFRSHGRGHPTVVHGKITLGFKGTQVLVQDQCRVRHGVDQFKIHVLSGSVDVRRGTKLLMTLHSARHGFFHTRGPSAEATVRG